MKFIELTKYIKMHGQGKLFVNIASIETIGVKEKEGEQYTCIDFISYHNISLYVTETPEQILELIKKVEAQ